MNTKKNINYLKRYQEVVIFLVGRDILKKYKSFDEYKSSSSFDKAYKTGGGTLLQHVSVQSLTFVGTPQKCRKAEFDKASSHLFKYHRKFSRQHQSGKRFIKNAWYELADSVVKSVFENANCWTTSNMSLIGKDAHKWIDKHIYKYITKDNTEEGNMTKTEKENLKRECEQGRHALSYEVLVKDIEKKECRAKKAQERRIKRVAQKTLVEEQMAITKLELENAELKCYVKTLQDADAENAVLREKLEQMSVRMQKLEDFAKTMRAITSDMQRLDAWYEKMALKLCSDASNQAKPQQDITGDTLDDIRDTRASLQIKTTSQCPEASKEVPDDVPEDMSDVARKSKVAHRLEEFTLKNYLCPREAEHLAKIYRLQACMPSSYDTQKLQQNAKARAIIYKQVLQELQSYEKELNHNDITWLVHRYKVSCGQAQMNMHALARYMTSA